MANRVLIVQMDMRSAQPLTRYFKQRGDEVWQAWDLGQAQSLFEQVKPQLLLLDLHFPNTEWLTFLRQARQAIPGLKVIITNKYPDLQREMQAREQGVQVFLRQPYSPRWIEQAVQRLKGDTIPAARQAPTVARPGSVHLPIQVKITLPYLLLALLLTLAMAYLMSRVVMESIQDRFLNQLVKTGLQSQDWMVSEEDRLLEILRLTANTQGLAAAMQARDAETLRAAIIPIAANALVEEIVLIDPIGTRMLTLTHTPGGGPEEYQATQGGDDPAQWDFVRRVLSGQKDAGGDKFAGRGGGSLGEMFFVAGPIFDDNGVQVGAVLVGKPLQTLARDLARDTFSDATLYDLQGQPLTSTLQQVNLTPVNGNLVISMLNAQDNVSQTRDLTGSALRYSEILAPWEVRGGEDLGVMGVSLPQTFLISTSRATQVQIFIIVAAGILLVIVVGVLLSGLITRPLMKLVQASAEVAKGNLEVKVDARGDDEIAILANSFNSMVAGLQEGSIYRDLLGRTVSPEVREQLRQTFSSGGLRLEGQEAVATVLMTDIRGFTSLSEKYDPATVFQWLNEYFSQLVPIVTSHGGVVNQFGGDAVLVFFGMLPRLLSPKNSAMAACQAASEALEAINKLNATRRARGEPLLVTGFGINTGVLMAGGLGTSDRLHYTVIGDTVNSAQRLESLTRDLFDTSAILVSHSTYSALAENQTLFSFEPLGYHQVRGKLEKIQIYSLQTPNSNGGWKGML